MKKNDHNFPDKLMAILSQKILLSVRTNVIPKGIQTTIEVDPNLMNLATPSERIKIEKVLNTLAGTLNELYERNTNIGRYVFSLRDDFNDKSGALDDETVQALDAVLKASFERED